MPIRPKHRFSTDRLAAAVNRDPLRASQGAAARPVSVRTGRLSTISVMAAGGMRRLERGRDGRAGYPFSPRRRRCAHAVHWTRIVLAATHRDRDTSNNANANLAAFCQRCHMIHDRPKLRRRCWFMLFRRKAMGDLFGGPYAERVMA